jgi:hypothetical protein
MNRKNYSALAVLAVLVAAAVVVVGGKSTKAEAGTSTLRTPKGSYMTNIRANVEKRDLVITRLFDAPIEVVWKAWTDPEYVMRWWGPTGFTSPSCKIDFREGGKFIFHMRAPKEFQGG